MSSQKMNQNNQSIIISEMEVSVVLDNALLVVSFSWPH